MPTYIYTVPIDPTDLGKPAPSFNTNIDMLPAFKPMVHDLMYEFGMREVHVIEQLLTFCATGVNYDAILDHFSHRQA